MNSGQFNSLTEYDCPQSIQGSPPLFLILSSLSRLTFLIALLKVNAKICFHSVTQLAVGGWGAGVGHSGTCHVVKDS